MTLSARRGMACVATTLLLVLAVFGGGGDTAPDSAPVRFGLFTDLHAHDLDSPLEGKWMTHTAERLGAFCDAMNAQRVDFAIQLGDFINGWVVLGTDPGDPSRIPEVLAWADGLYAAFRGPRYHVLGNHDVYNLDKATLRKILGIERTYYSFDVRGVHFVVLDVQYAEDGTDLARTYTGVAGFVPPAELEWLREDLAASDHATIVFVHQMLDAYVEAWGRPLVANQPEVQAVLSADGDVAAVFQGHDHTFRRTEVDGIEYITFKALVDQGTLPSWAVVTVDPLARTVTVDGAGEQPSFAFTYEENP
ncbi:MAG: metallophosphoesterase [Candidatus Bipolaricaulis sp.]|nr:metallophosphoesterase [Candidatus Bipolaricaulis sp.]